MKRGKVALVLSCRSLCILLLLAGEAEVLGAQAYPRGVAPEDRQYFGGKTVRCRDGSKTIPAERVNDDFCDCTDGTDEPGTSACANGRFHCRNRGHRPAVLFSSHVNDGICDCCDGSDEYSGRAACPNTCVEEGAASRQQLADAVRTYKEGVKLRAKSVAAAARKRERWSAEVESAGAKIAGLKEKEKVLGEAKAAVEKVEAEERARGEALRREEEERERARQAEAAPPEEAADSAAAEEEVQVAEGTEGEGGAEGAVSASHETHEEAAASHETFEEAVASHETYEEAAYAGEDLPMPQDPEEEPAEAEPVAAGEQGSQDLTEGLSKEELGALVASRWTGGGGAGGGASPEASPPPDPPGLEEGLEEGEEEDGVEEGEDDDDEFGDDHDAGEHFVPDHDADGPEGGDEEYSDDSSVYEAHHHEHEEDSDDDADASEGSGVGGGSPASVWWKQLMQWPRDMSRKLYSYMSPTSMAPANATDAEAVKKSYQEVADELRKLESRVRKLNKNLAADYGPEGEFVAFVDQCYSLTLNQYIYEVCPYSKAVQKEGHITTRLGDWTGFKDGHTLLSFQNGDHCWNGPARSMTVKLVCGLKAEIRAVDEPSRCEYAAVLATPAACSPARARELEEELADKLADLKESTDQADHDEL